MSKTLKEVNKELNKEYPKFLKAIPKLKNKEVFKQKIWKLLEELVLQIMTSMQSETWEWYLKAML